MSMSDEQFEYAIGHFIVEIQEQMRARDTAQREALARVEAEAGRLAEAGLAAHVKATAAQTQLADVLYILDQHRTWTGMGWEQLPVPVHAVEKIRSKLAPAEQQEAQGAQAGGLASAVRVLLEVPQLQGEQAFSAQPIIDRVRTALATQPAAGEPVADVRDAFEEAWSQAMCNDEGVPGPKPLRSLVDPEEYRGGGVKFAWRWFQRGAQAYAQPAAAPVAAGEPVAKYRERSNHHVIRRDESLPCYCWAESDHRIGQEVAAPPAAAHGDEAVRKDATEAVMQRACAELPEDWYIEIHLENGSGYATLFDDGIVVDFGQDFESIGAQVEAAIDAAMRAQGDGEPS